MYYDEFRAMNSAVLLAASGGDSGKVQDGFSQARDYIDRSEQRFTRFTDTSELARLNRSAGNWFIASADMFQVVEQAYRLVGETDGLFDPAILPALQGAGYDRSMDQLRNSPPSHSPVQVWEKVSFTEVQLDPATHSLRLPEGMQIDLGGIAKGWIAEQAAWLLARFSDTCAVSAGGDMVMINLPPGEPDWEVGLEDPLEPERDLAVLHVCEGALATSSITKRHWQHNDKLQHHLIDPRTGEPAVTQWLSVTVWAERAVQAEVFAKAILIGGPSVAARLSSSHPSIAYLAVDNNRWVHGSENYHEVFHV